MYPFMGFMHLGSISGGKVPETFSLTGIPVRNYVRSTGNYVKPIGKSPFPGGKYIKPSRK